MIVRTRIVMMAIVPVTFGKTDMRCVFVLIREMSPGVMERKVLTMTTTTRTIKRTHLVIADSNQDNRKCVTKFLPREDPFQHDWQCASGLECSFRFGGDMCYHIPDVITP